MTGVVLHEPTYDRLHERLRVANEARSWIGTPFHHAARVKGAGVDCAQLLIAVYAGLDLVDAPQLEAYPRDWFLHQDRERILEALAPLCVAVDRPRTGDIALFRYGRSTSHAAIVVAVDVHITVVHSFRLRGVVLDEISTHSHLQERLAGYWTLRRWCEGDAEATV